MVKNPIYSTATGCALWKGSRRRDAHEGYPGLDGTCFRNHKALVEGILVIGGFARGQGLDRGEVAILLSPQSRAGCFESEAFQAER